MLVKAVKIEEAKAEVASLDKGKNVCLNDVVKPNSRHPPRKQPSPRFVPTCHHCGIVGHTRLNCFQLRSQIRFVGLAIPEWFYF